MKRSIQFILCLLSLILTFSGCRKKEWDDFYGRPEWLADPMYKQLEARKNFTSFLSVVDKAGYKDILSSQGWWTLFAPNDDAFKQFLVEKGLRDVSEIDEALAGAIVRYSLVIDAYRKDQIANQQTAAGVVPNVAYKRRSSYYDFIKDGPGGDIKKILDGNSIAPDGVNSGLYNPQDNNNKHIPFFVDGFMTQKKLVPSDYNDLFPEATYGGFNVAGARVVNADIIAENGVIHEIDRVITPLKNIDEQLGSDSKYSEFKKLLDDNLVSYSLNPDLTKRYNILTGSSDNVYVKLYSRALTFAPNSENYVDNTTSAQIDGFSMVAPTNEALKTYLYGPTGKEGILSKYGTFEKAPASVLNDFINAHMWGSSLWPSQLTETKNAQNEAATFGSSDILEKRLMSNGLFYGSNKVQEANVFRTVYSKPYLDPAYLLMVKALDETSLKYSLINPSMKYTLFLISDQQFNDAGYGYNTQFLNWTYTVNSVVQGAEVSKSRVHRIVQTSVAPSEVQDLSGSGIIQAFNEEYIKYRDGKVYAAGNEDAGDAVEIVSKEETTNGPVYYTKGLLKFTEKELGFHLQKLATARPAEFGHFFNFLDNSLVYDKVTQIITGTSTGTYYTIFVPTNDAIEQAVREGFLPGNVTTGAPTFSPAADKINQVSDFIKYHILNKKTIAADGKSDSPLAVETLLSNLQGEKEYINVTKQPSGLLLRDTRGNTVSINVPASNNLANRTLIHSIGKVLKYGE